jgi:hypothetical protein
MDCNLETAPSLPAEPGTFTQTYEASWFRSTKHEDTTCDPVDQVVEITCLENHTIAFVGHTNVDSVTCEQTGDSVLRCNDVVTISGAATTADLMAFNNGVIYECSGPALAGTTLTIDATTISCDVDPVHEGSNLALHATIATQCRGTFLSSGNFLECPEASKASPYGFFLGKFSCITNVAVPSTTGRMQSLNMPTTTASTTSQSALYLEAMECYSFQASNGLIAPINAPITVSAPASVSTPTVAPKSAPIAKPSPAPVSSPRAPPPVPADTSSTGQVTFSRNNLLLGVVWLIHMHFYLLF